MKDSVQSSTEHPFFEQFFCSAPPGTDVEAIREELLSLRPPYGVHSRTLPLPIWARRSFTDTGKHAWTTLGQDLTIGDRTNPFCLYIHIPFCASRCGFCDCYSFALGKHQRALHIDKYLSILAQEIHLWGRLEALRDRAVSTVHFGGGTPTYFGIEPFRHLVRHVSDNFNTSPETEWAIETTTTELTDEMCALLDELGFSRLHMGVQSLKDSVRRNLKRREPAAIVLEKIARAVKRRWVVSVDFILNLPGQTLQGALEDIERMEAVGVDGFSIYELQLSSRNRRFSERHDLAAQNPLNGYLLFQAISRRLTSLGYRKNMFNHFARNGDSNLYFTFPERNEDCLAMGTIADGVFGDYHYRHPDYKRYCRDVSETFPGLQGGLRRTNAENRIRPLEVSLLSGNLSKRLFSDILGEKAANGLLFQWHQSALVEESVEKDLLQLTANGSWVIGRMMEQLAACYQKC